ncbi:hypothetical protein HaLaN_13725 [Haematococcus lacustris]|uniref:Uncharacterized protein n=1 Tax=Haematococcus lacustris TaxID=44745 RepID=A0A699ZCZ8_HAELA|nr:hypothetical protein HaLaN_13725 [Haematococcus lacustris]
MPILVSGSRVTLVSSPGIEYAVTVRNINNVIFRAFPCQTVRGPGCHPNQLTNFKFAAAQTLTATSAEDVSNIQDLKHGKLQLEWWQSEEAPRKARPAAAVVATSGFSAGTGAQPPRLPEGKKFFMAPSLSTSGGAMGEVMNLVQGDKLELRVVVRGRVMRRDEFAVCDLTQQDSTPAWQIKKKPRLSLD